jgi:hypothetical protein
VEWPSTKPIQTFLKARHPLWACWFLQFQHPSIFEDFSVWLIFIVEFGTSIRWAQCLYRNSPAFMWSISSGHGGSECIVVREVCFRSWVLLFLRLYLIFEDLAMMAGHFVCLLLDQCLGRFSWNWFAALNWSDWCFLLMLAVLEVIWLSRPYLFRFVAELFQ